MKRVAPIALEAVCLGTSVLDSNCSEPLRWLFGAGEYGAGVRTLFVGAASARDTVLGSEATGRILRRGLLAFGRAWMLCHAGPAGCQWCALLCVPKIWVFTERPDPS